MRDGAFDDLPGAGRPLALDDDPLVPEDVRVAHRILKNAGFLPAEVATRHEIASLRALLRQTTDEAEQRRASARLALLESALDARGRALEPGYRTHLLTRFARRR